MTLRCGLLPRRLLYRWWARTVDNASRNSWVLQLGSISILRIETTAGESLESEMTPIDSQESLYHVGESVNREGGNTIGKHLLQHIANSGGRSCRTIGNLLLQGFFEPSICFSEPGRFGKPFENDNSRSGQSRFARHPWPGRAPTATTTSGPEESTWFWASSYLPNSRPFVKTVTKGGFSPLAPADAMFRFQALAFRLARARDSGCYPAGS